jgi:hypothetical protein
MPSPWQIVVNTPLWVWPLLLVVLWLGWRGRKPSVVSWRLGILPLIGVVNSLVGVALAPAPLVAAASWLAALLAALPPGYLIGNRRAVRHLPDGKSEAAGGWFSMIFGLSIFAVRYALGVLFGVLPALETDLLWIALANGVGGVVAGIGLGWLASLLVRARQPARTA